MKIVENILRAITLISIVILGLASVGSVGYALYLWGGVGIDIGLALWTAFKIWITVMVCGSIVFLTSSYGLYKMEAL